MSGKKQVLQYVLIGRIFIHVCSSGEKQELLIGRISIQVFSSAENSCGTYPPFLRAKDDTRVSTVCMVVRTYRYELAAQGPYLV